jgi:segregation and condensation protein A
LQRIEIEDFSGPLELLLTLVQQEELSLSRIRLLEILNQALAGLEQDADLNESGDLLMIISTLMELKSKLLLPGEVDIGEEIQALKDDLLAKVLVHRRLSQVLDSLEYRWERRAEMLGRPNLLLDKEMVMKPMDQQNPFVLFTSLSGLLELARQDELRVHYDIRPIDEYFDWLEETWKDRPFTLRGLIRQRKDLLDATGVIIAVLELVRIGRLIMGELPGDVNFEWGDPELKKLDLVAEDDAADAAALIAKQATMNEDEAQSSSNNNSPKALDDEDDVDDESEDSVDEETELSDDFEDDNAKED